MARETKKAARRRPFLIVTPANVGMTAVGIPAFTGMTASVSASQTLGNGRAQIAR